MFVYNNSEELDIATYEYRLYSEDQVEADPANPGFYRLVGNAAIDSIGTTPYRQGFNLANVFTVTVTNSSTNSIFSVTSPVSYYGAIRAIDTSTNASPWSLLVKTNTDMPLIEDQHIAGLTAGKITAGQIGAAQITLAGANSIIKSSTYDFNNESTTSGWFISGDGHFSLGGVNGITYDNETIVIGDDVQVTANLAADSISVGGVTKLNINDGIAGGVGGMTVGDPTYNYWYANGLFSVGASGNYFKWDGTNVSTTGAIIGTPSISNGTINGSTLNVGTGANSFHVDVSGNIWSGAATYNQDTNPFSVSATGNLKATSVTLVNPAINNAVITGGTLDIGGSDNSSFHVDSSGNIWSGAGSYNAAPFKVSSGGALTSVSGAIGGWDINSSGLSKTVSGSSSYIYPAQIVLGILTDEVSGTTILSAARMTMDDANYFSRVKTDGISIQEYATGLTSYYKQFGAYIQGGITTTNASTIAGHRFNVTTGIKFAGPLKGSYSNMPGDDNFSLNFQFSNNGYMYALVNGDNNAVRRWSTSAVSDRRLKDNLSLDVSSHLQKFYSLKAYEFEFNDKKPFVGGTYVPTGEKEIGLIADEVRGVFPNMVLGNEEEVYLQVDYQDFCKLLIAASLDQNKRIEELSSKVEELQSRLI